MGWGKVSGFYAGRAGRLWRAARARTPGLPVPSALPSFPRRSLMKPTLLADLTAVPRPVQAYPTLRESWSFVGWYLLAALVVGGGWYVLLRYTTSLPKIQLSITSSIAADVGLLAFLRWKAGARWPRWQLLGQARIWHFALLPAVVVAAQVVLSLLDFLHLPDILTKDFGNLNQYFGVALLTRVMAMPVLEELLFRGVILNGLLGSRRPWVAIGQSALLFGLIHFNPAQSLSAGLAGVLLGWLYYRTRSLGLCIGLHALNNGLILVLTHWASAGWQHTDFLELFPSAAYYAGAVVLSAAGLAAYVRGVACSTGTGQ